MENGIDLTPANNPSAEYDRLGWLQRRADREFTNFDDMIPYLQGRSLCAQTETVRNRDIAFEVSERPTTRDEMNYLGLICDGLPTPIAFTHWSFGQLCQLAKAPAAFMRSLPAQLVRDNLEFLLRYVREVEEVKIYSDSQQLRAVTGPGYGRIDDAEVALAVKTIVDESAWKPAADHMGFRLTDRALNLFLIDETNPIVTGTTIKGADDVYYRGLRISNSEVGAGALHVEGFLFRSYCTNGCIFGLNNAAKISIRHSKNAPFRWAREVQPALEQYAQSDNKQLIESIESARAARVASDDDEMIDWLNNRGLSRSQAKLAIDRVNNEEGHAARTAWDAVQGITAVARDSTAYVDDRVEMDRIAGRIFEKIAA